MANSTPNLGISHIATNQNQKEVTANTAFDELDGALTGLLSKAFPSDANYTLTATEGGEAFGYMVYVFTGTLTATRNIIVPTSKTKLYIVSNATTGGHDIVVKTAAGTGITVANGAGYAVLYCNGVNVVQITPAGVTGSGPVVLAASPTITTPKFTAYTVAALAGLAPSEGQLAYATDGLKVGETTGAGTGVPVYFSNGNWRVFSTDATVAS